MTQNPASTQAGRGWDGSSHDLYGVSRSMAPGTFRRLDQELVARGLAATRSRAQALIKGGSVSLRGRVCTKPSAQVGPDDSLGISRGEDYASRGALKLLGALEAFTGSGLPGPMGRSCLDVGASTGGFTDVLLRRGASRVIALDVGHGQLIDRLAEDPRVVEMSGVNIRQVGPEDLPYRPDYVVSDVSFISLTYVIPVLPALIAAETECLLLVKPQFEVGREHLGHHGIVKDENERRQALDRVCDCAMESGFTVRGVAVSPIKGVHGNVEYLLWLGFHRV